MQELGGLNNFSAGLVTSVEEISQDKHATMNPNATKSPIMDALINQATSEGSRDTRGHREVDLTHKKNVVEAGITGTIAEGNG